MDAINFIGIGLAFFLSSLLIIKKKKGNFDYILMAWLILNGVSLYFFYLNFVKATEQFVPTLIAMGLIPYLVSPLLFVYVSSLVQGNRFSWYRQSPHLLPYITMLFSMLFYYWFPSENYSISVAYGFINVSGNLPFYIKYWALIMAFSAFIYPVLCLVKLFKHRAAIENEFSSLKNKTLDWMRYWIIIEMIGFWISFLFVISSEGNMLQYLVSFKVISVLIILNIFVVGYFGVKQSNIFIGPQIVRENDDFEKYKHSNLKSDKASQLIDELKERMKVDKPYRNPALSAADMAGLLGLTKHQFSQLINQQTGSNFYEFVNQFRIDEFKRKIQEGEAEKLSLLGLAFDCGFNSKSTFNHFFKKIEGMTPSEYRKKVA